MALSTFKRLGFVLLLTAATLPSAFALTLETTLDSSVFPNEMATLRITATADEDTDTLIGSVDWGDETVSELEREVDANMMAEFQLSHAYAEAGDYEVSVCFDEMCDAYTISVLESGVAYPEFSIEGYHTDQLVFDVTLTNNGDTAWDVAGLQIHLDGLWIAEPTMEDFGSSYDSVPAGESLAVEYALPEVVTRQFAGETHTLSLCWEESCVDYDFAYTFVASEEEPDGQPWEPIMEATVWMEEDTSVEPVAEEDGDLKPGHNDLNSSRHYRDEAQGLVNGGIIHGQCPHILAAERQVLRAEVVKVVSRMFGFTQVDHNVGLMASASSYSDFGTDEDLSYYVELLTNLGILKGYEDGEFRGHEAMTVAEMEALFSRVFGETFRMYEMPDESTMTRGEFFDYMWDTFVR